MKKLLSIILTALLLTNLIGVNYIHAEEGETLSEPTVENVVEETTNEEEAVVEEETTAPEETIEEEIPIVEEEIQEEIKEEEVPVVEEEKQQEEIIEEENIEEEASEEEPLLLEEGPLGGIDDDASNYVEFNVGTYYYSGHHQSPELSLKNVILYSFDSIEYTYYDSNGEIVDECIDAGAYTVEVTAVVKSAIRTVGTANVSTKFEIQQCEVELHWSDSIVYYDGTDKTYELLPYLSDIDDYFSVIDHVEITQNIGDGVYVPVEPINAGLYNVTVYPKEETKNFKVSEEAQLSNEVIVAPAEITVNWPSVKTLTYDGYSYRESFMPEIEGVAEGDDIGLSVFIKNEDSESVSEPTIPGDYYVTAYVSGNKEDLNNYSYNEIYTESYTIQKCIIYVKWPSRQTILGREEIIDTFTYDGENHYGDCLPEFYTNYAMTEYFYRYDAITIDVYDNKTGTIIDNEEVINAGTYTTNIYLNKDVEDYEYFSFAGDSHTFTINKATVYAELLTSRSSTYDGTSKEELIKPNLYSDLLHRNPIEDKSIADIVINSYTNPLGESEYAEDMINAGTYNVSLSLNDNYELAAISGLEYNSWDYTINQKPLSLVWNVGANLTYNGEDHYDEVLPDIVGIVEGEEDQVTLELINDDYSGKAEFINAGEYPIIAVFTLSTNYSVPNDTSHVVTINKRPITAYSDDDSSMIYKTYDPNGIKITSDEVQLYYKDDNEEYHLIEDAYEPSDIILGDARLIFTVDPIHPEGNIYRLNAGFYGIELSLDENSDLAKNNEFDIEKDDNLLAVCVNQKDVYFVGVSSDSEIKWGTEEEPYSVTWRNSTATYQGYELLPPLLNFEDNDGNDVILCPDVDYTYNVDGTLLNAGTYNVGINGADMGYSNYNIVDQDKVHFSLTIMPKSVSVNWTRLYGAYNENALVPEYEIVGLVPNDEGLIGLKLIYDGDEEFEGRPSDIGVHEAFIDGFEYIYPSDKAPNECFNYELADGFDRFVKFSIVGDNFEHNDEDDADVSSYSINNSVQLESLSLKCPSGMDLIDILLANEGTELAYALDNMLFNDGTANVYLTAEDVDPKLINFASGLSKDNCVFFDLTLNIDTYHHTAGNHVVFKVTETGDYFVEVTFKINQEQANKIGYANNKDFFVVNNHEGEPFTIKLDAPSYDETTGLYTFTFKTNKFCTFYLYSTNKPGGGGSNHNHSVPNTTTTLEFETNSIVDVKTCYKKEEDYDLEEEF